MSKLLKKGSTYFKSEFGANNFIYPASVSFVTTEARLVHLLPSIKDWDKKGMVALKLGNDVVWTLPNNITDRSTGG